MVQAFTDHWIDSWQKKGWKTSTGTPVENQDLWFILLAQTKKHHVTFIKVKGAREKRVVVEISGVIVVATATLVCDLVEILNENPEK